MGGLSTDPDKKRRQLEALAGNNPAVRKKLDAGEYDFEPHPDVRGAEMRGQPVDVVRPASVDPDTNRTSPQTTTTAGGLPVVGYQEQPDAPRPKPAREPQPAAQSGGPAAEGGPEREPRKRGALADFWDGFASG